MNSQLKLLVGLTLALTVSATYAVEILNITKSNINNVIDKAGKPVVIKAYAEWCGSCKVNKPVYEKIAQTLSKKYLFGQFNIDQEKQLAERFNVEGVPAFIFVKNNNVVGSAIGALPEAKLTAAIKKHLGK